MERRVLIVESQNDFALTMASVLKDAGYQTTLATSAQDAGRELEKRRPDLVVLRAELPDQSGFVLCGSIRKGKFGQNLPVILLSSESHVEALQQHATSPNAAHGYLAIPFDMSELTRLSTTIAPPTGSGIVAANAGAAPEDGPAGPGAPTVEIPVAAPPPLKAAAPGAPPRLPRRERRSQLTDEDRSFLDRAFQSIADRKAELLAESRELRRSAPRRDMLGTPEAKIQILRDELKTREAQLARISEIWTVRERELLSVEDRIQEKDVEAQGLKMQIDDVTRRLTEAQNTLVDKEREHGRQVEDLLLQKFIGEKEVIEVVSAKEKDINALRKEVNARDDELGKKNAELESQRQEYEALEKDYQLATLEFEVKEKELKETVAQRNDELTQLKAELEQLQQLQQDTVAERDTRYAEYEGAAKALQETLDRNQAERDATVQQLESNLRLSNERGDRGEAETARLEAELTETRARSASKVGELEGEIAGLNNTLDTLRADMAETEQTLGDKLSEREARIGQLERELADTIERKDREEAELQSAIQEKLEKIGELEGEVEAVKHAMADREAELQASLDDVTAQLAEARGVNEA
ncbi:MAG: response regulator, partial [Myxococcaceae bacterium]|nr:response regulator [Myxococcaceae bacterium]